MCSEKRGFFSIDALFALTLLLMISASFLNIYEGRRAAVETMGAKFEARAIGEKLAAVINTVYANGTYFEMMVNLPENLGNRLYQIIFDNSKGFISVEDPAWGSIEIGVVFDNVRNFTLDSESLRKSIRVYWAENQIRVGS